MGVQKPEQVEVSEENTSVPVEMDGKSVSNLQKESEEPTKTASVDINGIKGEVKEADKVATPDVPKDAVDEWPANKQYHSFYFVRVRSYEDSQLKSKIDNLGKDLEQKNQARSKIIEELRAKRLQRSNLKSELQPFLSENRRFREEMDKKIGEIKPLRDALGELRTASNASRDRGVGLCSSEEELNDLILSLNYRIQHESNTLVQEKQLLKEIKQLEATREKVIANASMKAKIEDSKIQDKVKVLGADMDGVRKEKQVVIAQIKQIDEEVKAIEKDINELEEQLQAITEKRDKVYETLSSMRKSRDDVNACFYQNRSLLNTAKNLAAKKDIGGLESLHNIEGEKFMSQWSCNKAFRDDYERRILSSLDQRQLSRDGRMRNPDEKPIIQETTKTSMLETSLLKVTPQHAKESVKAPSTQETVFSKKTQKEEPSKLTKATVGEKVNGTEKNTQGEEELVISTKAHEAEQKPKENDAAKLKEMKREEEIAKAKSAIERKKKLAEKAAAKAAARAQKEAEKKLKDKEKKAKKKAATIEPTPSENPETDMQAAEPEESDEKLDEKPVPEVGKERKVNIRHKNRPKVKDQIPKVILKRKKSSYSYGYWAAIAAVLAVVLVVVLGYYYGRVGGI